MQPTDFLETGLPSLPLRSPCRLVRLPHRGCGCTRGHVGGRLVTVAPEPRPDRSRAPLKDPLGDLAGVLHQVPAVGDLHGVRRGLAGSLGVDTGPITGDDLDARVLTEPCGDSRRLAVREEVDDVPPLEVDADGAVP